ncbi:aldo/keto reductase, partial [Parafrankia sp. FMc6]
MRYRRFGTTGVEVSTQCLGTMNFGRLGSTDPDDNVRIINRAL